MTKRYLEPTQEAGAALFSRQVSGEMVMLNLLRFREIADYADSSELAPAEPISGRDAYKLYMAHTTPFLEQSGGDLVFLGEGGKYLIGPAEDQWDMVMLIRQKSLSDFMAFASNPGYLAGMGHRTAALEDSRLLPMVEFQDGQMDKPSG
jgi:uncharacterized protein (DUF1330 family)